MILFLLLKNISEEIEISLASGPAVMRESGSFVQGQYWQELIAGPSTDPGNRIPRDIY